MSLEASMSALAEANLALAQALTGYAAVIDKYALKIEAVGGNVAAAAAAETPPATPTAPAKKTPAKKTAATKTEPPPAADDGGFGDDGFGGAGEETTVDVPAKLTGDQVKAKLLEVRDAYGDKAPALKIINDLGYNAIPDVKPADFAAVWVACEKAIAAAQ
jgi:hypothetical protein